MRIWDVPPGELDRQALLAEHRELHAVWTILADGRKGYRRHPEVVRWQGRLGALYRRHETLVAEMVRRGYRHASPLDGDRIPPADETAWQPPAPLIALDEQRRRLAGKAATRRHPDALGDALRVNRSHHHPEGFDPQGLVAGEARHRAWFDPAALVAPLVRRRPRRILDLGAGAGFFTLALARTAPWSEVVAVDRQADMARTTAARAAEAGLDHVRTLVADAARLPLPDDFADACVVATALHDMAEPAAVVAEIARVLAPGGRLLVVEYRPEAGDEGPPAELLLSPAVVRALVRGAGMRPLRTVPGPGPLYRVLAGSST